MCFLLFRFVCGDIRAQCSTNTALILLLIGEMGEYLDGFILEGDEINCIPYTVGIGSIIYYVKTLLSLLIVSTTTEIGLLILLILNTDGLSFNSINTSATAEKSDEFALFARSTICSRI